MLKVGRLADSKGMNTELLKDKTICIDWKYKILFRELNYKIVFPI